MRYIILIIFVITLKIQVYGETSVRIGATLEDTDLGKLEELTRERYKLDIKELIGGLMSGEEVSLKAVVADLLPGELMEGKDLIKTILLICLINGLVAGAMAGFGDPIAGTMADYAAFVAVAGLLIQGYSLCADVVAQEARELVELIQAATPMIIALISASGEGVAAVGYSGLIAMGTAGTGTLIGEIILPQLMLAFVLALVNSLWEGSMVGRLSELMALMGMWELKACAFLFTGALALGGLSSKGVPLAKGVKLAVGAVPVVGGLFENSIEGVLSFIGALRGSGAAALIILILLGAVGGLIRLLGVMLMYKLTAAITEPIGSKRVSRMVDCAGEGIRLLIGVYFTLIATAGAATLLMLVSLQGVSL